MFVLFPLLWVEGVWANCPNFFETLHSQAEVDALGATGCSRVLGSLTIESVNPNDAITNLDALANLWTVGSLYIRDNPSLTSVDGLANVRLFTALHVESNFLLKNLDAFVNITTLHSLRIENNPNLTNLNGLVNVTSIGDLRIENNPNLTNLNGLVNVTSIGDELTISDNSALTDCQALAPVLGWPNGPAEVGGAISIYRNGAWRCDSAMGVLESVAGPTQPVINQVTTTSSSISLEFSPSTTSDALFPITGYRASCVGSQEELVETAASTPIELFGPFQEADYTCTVAPISKLGVIPLSEPYPIKAPVDCPETNYILASQADINELSAEACIRVLGDLRVNMASDINNLDGLFKILSVGGDLWITNNAELTNLDGLANVTSVGGDLYIQYNDALTSLDGLSNLATVAGGLDITNNDVLTNLDGLINVTAIGATLWIGGNDALTSLDGLANVASIGGALGIVGNKALTNLDGLINTAAIGADLWITNNAELTNLDGLAKISVIEGDLWVESNAALTNLDGLVNVTNIGGKLDVYGNGALTKCQALAAVLGWPNGPPDDSVDGYILISQNDTGCDSLTQVLASIAVPTRPVITGATAIGGSGLQLSFNPSISADALFPVTAYEAMCAHVAPDLIEMPSAALLDNIPVTRALKVNGYDPVSVSSVIEVDIDITHIRPEHLYITLTTPQGTEVVLWDRGGAGTENLVGTFPTTLTPVDTINSVGRQSMDGDWVLTVEDVTVGPIVREGVLNSWGLRIAHELTATGSNPPLALYGLSRHLGYSCSVAPLTRLGLMPSSDPYLVTARLESPSTPYITSTDYGDGSITLRFGVADNGGASITRYDAICTDGTNTFTGTSTSSPITVSGLTNGVAYTCTVTATNSVGTSSSSTATAPIIPEWTQSGLPIWLLYEASK